MIELKEFLKGEIKMNKKIIMLSFIFLVLFAIPSIAEISETVVSDYKLVRSVNSNDSDLTNYDFNSRDPNRIFTLDQQFVTDQYSVNKSISRDIRLEFIVDVNGAEGDQIELDIGAYREKGTRFPVATLTGTVGTRSVVTDPNGDDAAGRYWVDTWSITDTWISAIEKQNKVDNKQFAFYVYDTLGFKYWDVKVSVNNTDEVNVWVATF